MRVPQALELFRLTDDGSGGPLQTFKRQLKLRWRVWRGRHSLRQVVLTLAYPELARLPVLDPQLLLRPLRSYLWNGLGRLQRARAFEAHFSWLRQQVDQADIDELYRSGGLPVTSLPLNGGALDVVLAPGRGLGREGELELHLFFSGQVLLRAAFSVLPVALLGGADKADNADKAAAPDPAASRAMVIGCVQGSVGRGDEMKALTHAAHRARPKALLLDALQALAEAWQIGRIVGVATRSHVYGRYRSLSRRVGMDYDAMWQELGAEQRSAHHWELPLQPQLRADEAVPSKKRAEHRRRCELRRALFGEVQRWAAQWVQRGRRNDLA